MNLYITYILETCLIGGSHVQVHSQKCEQLPAPHTHSFLYTHAYVERNLGITNYIRHIELHGMETNVITF